MDDPDESAPVSFKLLKERWQKHESSAIPNSVENSPRNSPMNTPPKSTTTTTRTTVAPTSKELSPHAAKTAIRPPEPTNNVNITPISPEVKRSLPVITPEVLAKKGTPPPPPISSSTVAAAARQTKLKEETENVDKPIQATVTDDIVTTAPKRVSMLSQQFEAAAQQQRSGAFTNKPVVTPREPVLNPKQPKSQTDTLDEKNMDLSSRQHSLDPRVGSGTFRQVVSPASESIVDTSLNGSKSEPPSIGESEESESESEEDSEDSDQEEESEDNLDPGYPVASESPFGDMHHAYSRSPDILHVANIKQKRAPPPPPVSRRNRIAQLQQQPGNQTQNPAALHVQDTLRHIPVHPVIADQPAKPPRQEAYEKPPQPVSVDHKTAQVLEQPAPVLPPRPPILPSRPTPSQNDLENLDPSMMNRPKQSPKPLSRARTIGGALDTTAPPLPSRPIESRASSLSRSSSVYKDSSSSDSHNIGTSEGSQTDRSSPGIRRAQTISRTERLFVHKLYPDQSNANRSPPYIDGSPLTVHHRGPVRAYAMSDSNVVTGAHSTRVYNIYTGDNIVTLDHTAVNDVNNRVCSMAFAPSLTFEDEGRYLWIGMQDGAIIVLDVLSGDIVGKRTDNHAAAITTMLRYRNKEMWTIDDNGVMIAWPFIEGTLTKGHSNHPLELHTRKDKVSKLNICHIVGRQLWMASGRVLDVYDVAESGSGNSTNKSHTRMPNNVGNISQLATVPYHQGKVFIGHDDGHLTVWDVDSVELMQTIPLSIYGVSCLLAVGEYHLWAGYNTGMIYVYDTRPERWVVVKMWKAHNGQVHNMILDESPLVKDKSMVQVASLDGNGTIQVWDGLLSSNWRDQAMNKQMPEYCDYRDAKILISSWNIDANKPEKFDQRDEQKIREWLTSMRDPDIIAVGIQEIVDLESKKQTAKSFFSSKKKSSVPMEEEELLTHRYRLWHNFLVHILASEYGTDVYTVVKTEQLVGLFSCIFVRTSEAERIFHKDSTVVKTGLKVMSKSIHGNKGGIAIRFLFDHTSLCFVNCHLAAGQSHVRQRNSDAEGILQLASLEPLPQYYDVFVNGGDGNFVLDHELCFMSGDFNYRIDMSREQVLKALSGTNKETIYATLQKEDQLRKQEITNPLFKLLIFKEPVILFDPTYKYDPGTDFYDRSEKKRIPAWCDRVLYRGPYVQNEHYTRHEARASDHRPISAGFYVKVKTIDDLRRDRIAEKVELAWHQTLEKLIQKKKIEWLIGYGLYSEQKAQQKLASANWRMMEAIQD